MSLRDGEEMPRLIGKVIRGAMPRQALSCPQPESSACRGMAGWHVSPVRPAAVGRTTAGQHGGRSSGGGESMTIDWGWGWGWGMGLWMLVGLALTVGVVVLIVWAVVSVVRGANDGGRGPQQTPLDILRERYARGEISAEEFEQAKRILGY